MEKVDFNIEYAHIYVNEGFNSEHKKAAFLFVERTKELGELGKSYSSVVLIDDYNPSEHLLSEERFLHLLAKRNAAPDFVGYEARIVPLVEDVLDAMDDKDAKSVRRYIVSRGRVPCSFLIVVWHLLRLGEIDDKKFGIYHPLDPLIDKPFVGKKLITILPERFKSVEERARDVIGRSQFGGVLDRLDYQFF